MLNNVFKLVNIVRPDLLACEDFFVPFSLLFFASDECLSTEVELSPSVTLSDLSLSQLACIRLISPTYERMGKHKGHST